VSADGRLAFSASHDNTLKAWDLETDRELYTLVGHQRGADSGRAAGGFRFV
jgi:WD40 repeat protein